MSELMKRLTVVRKMILGFSGLAMLLLLTSVMSFFGLQDIKASATAVVEEKMPMQDAMTSVRTEILSLSKLIIQAYYESDDLNLTAQKENFDLLLSNLHQDLNSLEKYVSTENKSKLIKTIEESDVFIAQSEQMFADISEKIALKKELMIASEKALSLADEASALMLDLSYIEGTGRDLESIVGMGDNIDNKLTLILGFIQELERAEEGAFIEQTISDMQFNITNIDADASYLNRLAETVETGGLVDTFNQEFSSLKALLSGDDGIYALQRKRLELISGADQSYLNANLALKQTNEILRVLTANVNSATLKGQEDILNTVNSNEIKNTVVSVIGISATFI
jgi:methyl-accepting chemotaxis protein